MKGPFISFSIIFLVSFLPSSLLLYCEWKLPFHFYHWIRPYEANGTVDVDFGRETASKGNSSPLLHSMVRRSTNSVWSSHAQPWLRQTEQRKSGEERSRNQSATIMLSPWTFLSTTSRSFQSFLQICLLPVLWISFNFSLCWLSNLGDRKAGHLWLLNYSSGTCGVQIRSSNKAWYFILYRNSSIGTHNLLVTRSYATFGGSSGRQFEPPKGMTQNPLKLGAHLQTNQVHLNTSCTHSISGPQLCKLVLTLNRRWKTYSLFRETPCK